MSNKILKKYNEEVSEGSVVGKFFTGASIYFAKKSLQSKSALSSGVYLAGAKILSGFARKPKSREELAEEELERDVKL